MRDLTIREALKELRKIDPTGFWTISYDECHQRYPYMIMNHRFRISGRTLRSCLTKLKREVKGG